MKAIIYFLLLLSPIIGLSQKKTLDQLFMECQRNSILFDALLLTKNPINKMSTNEIENQIQSSNDVLIKSHSKAFLNFYADKGYRPVVASNNSFLGEYISENKSAGLFFTSQLYDKIFSSNPQSLDEKIKQVYSNMTFDFLNDACDLLEETKVNNISVHTIFLTNVGDGDVSSDSFILNTSLSVLKNFKNKKITDQQFLKSSSVYVLTSSAKSFRKIGLK